MKNFHHFLKSSHQLASTVLIASLVGIISCNKNAVEPVSENSPKNSLLSSVIYPSSSRSLNMSEPELYLYPQDVAMERIDMARYALAKAFKDLINPALLIQLKSAAAQKANSALTFTTIFNLYPSLETSLNSNLSKQVLPQCKYDLSSYSKIKDALYNDKDQFEPELYFYNLSSKPNDSSFVLTPGLEIEDEPLFEDQIMGWKKDAKTDFTAIRINEEEAKLYLGTFMTIGLHGKVILGGSSPGFPTPNGPTPTVYKNINMKQVNIHFRYEKNGKSEIYAYGVKKSGTVWDKCFSTFPGDYSRHLCSTKKTWEWVNCDKNSQLFTVSDNVIWNTFERDWYMPPQPLAVFTGSVSKNAYAPMTFGSEWYGLIPESNNINVPKSLNMGSDLKNLILLNGTNWTYFKGENNKFECYFNATQ